MTGDPAPFESSKGLLWLSLFYNPKGAGNVQSLDQLIEHEATRIALRPPNGLTWPIFDAPEVRHYFTTPSGKRYALGVPYAYVDLNGDGRRSVGEDPIGEAPITAVLSVETALEAGESPTGKAVEPGFFMLVRPLWCAPRPAEPAPTAADCGVPLGAACAADGDCGAGVCLMNEPWPWPSGTCALPSSSTCVPEAAHLWRNHRDPSQQFWLPACASTADCRQPYQCDPGNGVCLPFGNLAIRISPTWRMLATCQPTMP